MSINDLTAAALIASGVPENERPMYIEEIQNLIGKLPVITGDIASDGEAILQWMHDAVLKRYVESQTRLDVLLDNGTYNCVSSAVLYMILAAAQDVPVHGVQTSDHAFCRVPLESDPEGGFDVETTIPYGFDPGRRHDAVDTFSGRTGFVYVPPGNYRRRTEIGEKDMIALIYQNRLAALQRSGKWIEAVGIARDRWQLAGSEASRNDFITALNNYSAEMNRRKAQVEGLNLLSEAQSILDDSTALSASAQALLHNAVTLHIKAGDTTGARNILAEDRFRQLVGDEFSDDLSRDIETSELETLVSSGDFNGGTMATDMAFSSGLISRSRWNEFTLYLWSEEARQLSSGGNWMEGWMFLSAATGDTKTLLNNRRVIANYRNNVIVSFHNRFVDAAREGKLQEAESILDEAQNLFPDDNTLARDRGELENM